MRIQSALFLALLWVLGTASLRAQDALTWTFETIGVGIKPALALDRNDVVHVAYIIEAMEGGVYYATDASGEWEISAVAEGYFYGPEDIAVDANGAPYIAYHDHQAQQFDPALGDEVVATLQDGAWVLTTVANPGHDGWDNSIAVDDAGSWHTASVDPKQFGSNDGVEYATNAYGEVIVEQIGSGPVPYEFATSIALRGDGTVGISFFNEQARDLVYAERSADGAWSLQIVDSERDAGRYSALAYDSQGNPHIAYFWKESRSDRNGVVRHAWRAASGVWQMEDVGALDNVPDGMTGARKIISLAIDENDGLHIAYSDRRRVAYATRDEDGWTEQVVYESESDAGDLGALVELALDSNGLPHLIFAQITNFTPLQGRVIYARPSAA